MQHSSLLGQVAVCDLLARNDWKSTEMLKYIF